MNTPLSSNFPLRRAARSAAFTLIELLVVISIIAVLAGLLLPVVNTVMKNARKTATREAEMQIVAAVNSYQTEYSQFPVPTATNSSSSGGKDYTYGVAKDGEAKNHNLDLFNVLRALNSLDPDSATGTLNVRRISYFEYKNVKSAGSPKDGFILTGSPKGNKNVAFKAGDFIDPFGNMYCVRVDGNYTNILMNPYAAGEQDSSDTVESSSSSSGSSNEGEAQRQIRTGVVSYSMGEDGQLGDKGAVGSPPYSPTPGDDVDSWQ